jgi:Ankyrin repeats (many copies)/Ankyrin repeats (3 copies)
MKRLLVSLLIVCLGTAAPAVACASAAGPKELALLIDAGRTEELRQALAGRSRDDMPLAARAALMTLALQKDRPEAVAALLDWGIGANHPLPFTPNGEPLTVTPLLYAVSSGSGIAVVDVLVKRGADVNRAAEGLRPLNFALSMRRYAVAAFLLDNGADVNGSDSLSGLTPLMDLVVSAQAEDAQALPLLVRLVAKGANVNARGTRGVTALRMAVTGNKLEMAKALLDAGADPNLANDKGETPLKLAEQRQSTDLAALLRSHGASR